MATRAFTELSFIVPQKHNTEIVLDLAATEIGNWYAGDFDQEYWHLSFQACEGGAPQHLIVEELLDDEAFATVRHALKYRAAKRFLHNFGRVYRIHLLSKRTLIYLSGFSIESNRLWWEDTNYA